MTWLLAAISAYLILAVVFLIDKFLLVSPIPNPKVYTFYVGFLRVVALVLVPFIAFKLPPSPYQLALALLAGASYIYGLFWFFKSLRAFEASRVVPVVTGITPVFSFLIVYLLGLSHSAGMFSGIDVFAREGEGLGVWFFSALALLIIGSILINYDKKNKISIHSVKYSVAAGFFLAVFFVFNKYVFMEQEFWSGFMWVNIGAIFMSLLFILSKDVRAEIFKKRVKKEKKSRKTAILFLSNQIMGSGAYMLQQVAILLVPAAAYISIVNALQGIQYVFLLIFATFLSLKFPTILKEKVTGQILIQKSIAILIIILGVVILILNSGLYSQT